MSCRSDAVNFVTLICVIGFGAEGRLLAGVVSVRVLCVHPPCALVSAVEPFRLVPFRGLVSGGAVTMTS